MSFSIFNHDIQLNEMFVKIKINGKLTFDGHSNESLLESAKKKNITFNHSCLSGRCSECRVKVSSGLYHMPKNQEGLTDDEVNEGYSLSCITTPLTDLVLEEVNFFEGTLPPIKTLPAKIDKLDILSNELAHLQLRTPPNNRLNFIPGQYIDLSINGIKRSYSIASTPNDNNIHLFIKNYTNGKFSNYLFQKAKENDLLRIEGPKGTYFLPEKNEKNIVFISTGTGIAPNLSIIKHAINNDILLPEQITIIHGQKYANEHVYNLEPVFKGIKIIKANSREKKDGFYFGYVQEALIEEGFDLKTIKIYACGNPNMIQESKKLFIANGLEESEFKSEIFINSN